jgi:hypothetical protein
MLTELQSLPRTASRPIHRCRAVRLSIGLVVTVLAVMFYGPPLLAGPVRFLWAQVSSIADSLTGAGDRRTTELLDAMGNHDVDIAVKARDVLAKLGEPAVPSLIERLQHPEPRMRAAAALVLGKVADQRAVGPLCEVLSDSDELVRFRAAYALGRLKNAQAVSSLAPLLLAPSIEIVNVALRALEECHCKVRFRTPLPGYEILPQGESQWQVIEQPTMPGGLAE